MIRVNLLGGMKEKLADSLIEKYQDSVRTRSDIPLTLPSMEFEAKSYGDVDIKAQREVIDIEKLLSSIRNEAARTSRTTKLQDFFWQKFLPKGCRNKRVRRYTQDVWTPYERSFVKEIYPLRLKRGSRTRLYRVSVSVEPDHGVDAHKIDYNSIIKFEPIGAMGFYWCYDVVRITTPMKEGKFSYPTQIRISSHCGKFIPSMMRLIFSYG